MSIYLKQIEQLVELQKVDSELLEIKKELELAPEEVRALEAEFAKVDASVQQVTEKTTFLKEQESRLSTEIEDDTLKVKKSKNKLMMVNNTKEYHAMMREMDNMEKMNRMREEERLALVEELSRQEEMMTELGAKSGEIKGQLEEKQSSLNVRVKEMEGHLAELMTQRRAAGKNVPGPVLSRYEFIRSRLAAPVIVPVEAGICDGCHISIPPQSYNELQKGQQILSCPNCQRLIYWSEHFTAPEDETKAPAEAE